VDILPDSRCQVRRGSTRVVVKGVAHNMIPVYCASCGKPWGMVPEKFCTFAFVTCDDCDRRHGVIAGLVCEPDAVFWQRVQAAQEKDAVSTLAQLAAKLDDPSSEYSKIARDWRAANSKEF
jgi:hypothetical protein